MKYALLVYETDQDQGLDHRGDPTVPDGLMAAHGAYVEYLGDKLRGGQGLEPVTTATTIRLRDGERHVQDGPFADTHERLGGFYIIEADNLDHAMELAERCPSARTGSVEIRPVLTVD